MKLTIKFSDFKEDIYKFRNELESLLKLEISNEKDLDEAKRSLELIKENCSSYIVSNISDDINLSIVNLIRYENRYNLSVKQTLAHQKKMFADRIRERVSTIDYLIEIIKISDPLYLGKSFIKERSSLTVNEKTEFLLSKLYALRKSDKLWDTKMIFEFNQVELDNFDEAREITKILNDYGFVEVIGNLNGLSAKITSKGKLFWEEQLKLSKFKSKNDKMDIFISHSSQDVELAKLLIDLLKTALNLSSSNIRCTSVNGYRLPAGASTNEVLKKEVHESKVLIGLISPSSINSAYVLFELGARWGASLPLIPLISNQLGSELLKGPLRGINALNCCEPAQVQQLISDLKKELVINGESPEVYQEKIDSLVEHSLKELLPEEDIKETVNNSKTKKAEKSNNNVDDKIKSYCEKEWPDDYSMRVHCIKEQRIAAKEIEKERPADIPENIFSRILEKAISEWPTDYTMQVHSRNEQIEAYRELNNL